MTILYQTLKRAIDVGVSSAAIAASPPILALAWLAVKIDDGGPLFYTQPRVGKNGKLFNFLKFRTMKVGADAVKSQVKADEDSIRFKAKADPRITRVGRWFRKWSVDELPQLWNVLKGDMSLVGPRPPLPVEVEQYTEHQRKRLAVEQGLTCFWQISGRSLIPFEQQVEMDLSYIKKRSLMTDLKILIATVPAVLSGRGAY